MSAHVIDYDYGGGDFMVKSSDGRLLSYGHASRQAARRWAEGHARHEMLLQHARERLKLTCDKLRDDGVTLAELVALLNAERDVRNAWLFFDFETRSGAPLSPVDFFRTKKRK